MPEAIEFYFDFSSPYAYFASHDIDGLAAEFGRTCRWKPILLAPAFQASGNQRLIDQPLKGPYVKHDWERLARLKAVPYRLPEPFPVGTVAAARTFWWLDAVAPDRAKAFARAVFAAYFAEGRDISDRQIVADVAVGQGIAAEDVLAALDAPAWKARCREETDGAIARGVFGAPFIIVDGEPFWGSDRLWMVRTWLERTG